MKFTSSHLRTAAAIFPLMSLIVFPFSAAQDRTNSNNGKAAPAGGYHALVIGNNEYSNLDKLKTAESDAREIAALLKESYGFNTTLLLNATRGQIVSELARYRRKLSTDARLLIYYAGHGINDPEDGRAYWLPVDAERDNPANWISADDITAGTRSIPAKQVLVISDSCYSGALMRGLAEALPRPSEREQYVKRMAQGKSRTLMASGGNEPVVDGGGGKHSVFAAALLKGLREMDKRQFTAGELFRGYVEERVVGQARQTPVYVFLQNSGHETGDFVFTGSKTGAGDGAGGGASSGPAMKDGPEEQAWQLLLNSKNPSHLRLFLKEFPDGKYAAEAKEKLADLVWAGLSAKMATKAGAKAAYESFLNEFPDSPWAKTARIGLLTGYTLGAPSVIIPPEETLTPVLMKLAVSELQARVRKFHSVLSNHPSATGVIFAYGTDREVARAEADIRRASAYRGAHMDRIQFVRGGTEPGLRMSFFVVPAGAEFPTP
jgi:hypothetical protein